MKFDCVASNPPYQHRNEGESGKPKIVWPDFVIKSISMLEKDGMLGMVHPPNWRDCGKLFGRIQGAIRGIDVSWLSVYDIEESKKVFGASTRFDAYAARNSCTAGFPTFMEDQKGNSCTIHLKELDMDFIPNSDIDFIRGLLADDEDGRVDFLYSSSKYFSYDLRDDPSDEFHLPCVYSMSVKEDGGMRLMYADSDRGFFGIPKVIFGTWHSPGIPFPDMEGKYGMCQDAAGIADDPENLESIAEAMKTERFAEVMKSIQFNTRGWNRKVIARFRKDFWKEFI